MPRPCFWNWLRSSGLTPSAMGIAAAHHELGDLAGVAAQHRLLVDEQPLDDVVAQVEAGAGHRPEGIAHHAHVGQQQLALPAWVEQVGEPLDLLFLHHVGVDGDARRRGWRRSRRSRARSFTSAKPRSKPPSQPASSLASGSTMAGRIGSHTPAGRSTCSAVLVGIDRHVPGEEVRLALLQDARGEVLRVQARVLELDVRIGLGERLERPLVAVAGEGVDDDLAFLLGRRHQLRSSPATAGPAARRAPTRRPRRRPARPRPRAAAAGVSVGRPSSRRLRPALAPAGSGRRPARAAPRPGSRPSGLRYSNGALRPP